MSLSKTHKSLLSNGSTQEDPSRHNEKLLTNTRKNIEDSAVSVVIRSVILSFNVFELCIEVQGPELQWLLKVKEGLNIDISTC